MHRVSGCHTSGAYRYAPRHTAAYIHRAGELPSLTSLIKADIIVFSYLNYESK